MVRFGRARRPGPREVKRPVKNVLSFDSRFSNLAARR